MKLKGFSLKRYRKLVIPLIILIIVAEGAALACGASFGKLQKGIVEGLSFLGYMFPPDWSAFAEMLQPAFQSIVIAFLGTVFGTLMSIVFAMLAASNLSYSW